MQLQVNEAHKITHYERLSLVKGHDSDIRAF